jgi:hypothetical protein
MAIRDNLIALLKKYLFPFYILRLLYIIRSIYRLADDVLQSIINTWPMDVIGTRLVSVNQPNAHQQFRKAIDI